MKRRIAREHALKKLCTMGAGIAMAAVATMMMAQAGGSNARENKDLLPDARFEVVSIHPDPPSPDGKVRMGIGFTPNGAFTARGITLKRLISIAYDVDEMQVTGGPDWLNQDRFTIEARADDATREQIRTLSGPEQKIVGQRLVRALMADRFKLTLQQETKEAPILALVVAKNGPKMKEATPGDTYANGLKDQNGQGHAGMMRFDGGSVTAQGVPLDNLTRLLTEQLHQVVENKTNLTGKYDFKLEWTPERDHDAGPGTNGDAGSGNGADGSQPGIFTAIQEQMGLKLEAQKGTVPAFAVEHVERPTEN